MPATVIKHHEQSKLGKKGFSWIILSCHSPSLREVRLALKAGTWRHEGVLLSGLLFTAYSACFLKNHQPRSGTAHSSLGPPTAIIHQGIYNGLVYRQISWKHFLI